MRCEVCTCHIGFIKLACNLISHAPAIALTAVCVCIQEPYDFQFTERVWAVTTGRGFVCISAYLKLCIHLSMAGVHVFTRLG